MTGRRHRMRERREQLEAMLATGQARLERARSRSLVVDTMVGVVRRERPVAVVFACSALAEEARADAKGLAGELTVILISAGVELAVLWLALSRTMPRPSAVPWTALVPGACLFAVGFIAFNLAVSLYFAPRAARASTVYGSLGLALILLVSLFLFARLAVAAAELNATLWERRRPAVAGG
jgi:uncharacterized BrkB/YihY/UPF0761 family membrane protein